MPDRGCRHRGSHSQAAQPWDDQHRRRAHRRALEIRRHHARRQSPHDRPASGARHRAAAPARQRRRRAERDRRSVRRHPRRHPGHRPSPRPAGRRSAWHLYAIEIDPAAFGCERDDGHRCAARRRDRGDAALPGGAPAHAVPRARRRSWHGASSRATVRAAGDAAALPGDDRLRPGRRHPRAAADTCVGGGGAIAS